jgi:hypothetical protein
MLIIVPLFSVDELSTIETLVCFIDSYLVEKGHSRVCADYGMDDPHISAEPTCGTGDTCLGAP